MFLEASVNNCWVHGVLCWLFCPTGLDMSLHKKVRYPSWTQLTVNGCADVLDTPGTTSQHHWPGPNLEDNAGAYTSTCVTPPTPPSPPCAMHFRTMAASVSRIKRNNRSNHHMHNPGALKYQNDQACSKPSTSTTNVQ